MYDGCPLVWKFQFQTDITLLSMEPEYTGMSYALREVTPIMQLLKELKRLGFPIESTMSSKTTVGRWRWQKSTSTELGPSTSKLNSAISETM